MQPATSTTTTSAQAPLLANSRLEAPVGVGPTIRPGALTSFRGLSVRGVSRIRSCLWKMGSSIRLIWCRGIGYVHVTYNRAKCQPRMSSCFPAAAVALGLAADYFKSLTHPFSSRCSRLRSTLPKPKVPSLATPSHLSRPTRRAICSFAYLHYHRYRQTPSIDNTSTNIDTR